MTELIDSIREEYLRYKALAEASFAQLTDEQLCDPGPGGQNSIAVLVWHLSGNLRSRFTEFLTSDLEKPWRQRDEEFVARVVPRAELLAKWEQGWSVLTGTFAPLTDAHLHQTVTVRGQALKAHEVLFRLLAHTASHVGQIVYIAKALRGADWQCLSIPPGQSAAYNQNPTGERAASHTQSLADRTSSGRRS